MGLGASHVLFTGSFSAPCLWKQRTVTEMALFCLYFVCGLSEQYVDLKDQILQGTSAVNAWKASSKLGHSFGAGREPKTPCAGYCREFPSHRVFAVLRGSFGC